VKHLSGAARLRAGRARAYLRMACSDSLEPLKNGRCRMHGGASTGSEGNRNALKHGRYTSEAIARRRAISLLIRYARNLGG
jgi:hypothetical protein